MRALRIFGCLVVGGGLAACGGGGSFGGGGKMLATVNSKAITAGDLDFLGTINPRLKAQAATPFGQKQIVENLVEQEILYQESVKRGLEHDPKVRAKADLYRRVIVAQAALDDEMDKAAKHYFDEHKSEFEKLELAHVLIRFKSAGEAAKDKTQPPVKETATRSEAQALALANSLKDRLAKGGEFANLAKEYSEDPGSKGAGGLLGKVWKEEPRLERRGYGPLLEKAFAMKVGEVDGPIKSPEGYHLLTVTKGVEAQPFDDAKQAILFKIQNDVRTKLLADLKEKAKVEYAEGLAEPKKSPEPTPPAAPPAAPAPTPEAKPAEAQPPPPAAPAKLQ